MPRDNPSSPAFSAAAVQTIRTLIWQNGFRPMAVYSWDFKEPLPPPGKKPGPTRAGKAPLGLKWQVGARKDPPEVIDLGTVVAWATNTGILCDGLRAIDLDIDDPAPVAQVRALALAMLGATIIRIRDNSPRCLLVYRAAEGAPHKLAVTGASHSKDNACKIEVLGWGNQFIGYGRHPSGADLLWPDGGPADMAMADIPAVTEIQVHGFLKAAAPVIGAPPPDAPRPTRERQPFTGEMTGDLVDIAAAVSVLKNDGPPDWESWNNVGLRIFAATAGADAGLDLFLGYSTKNPAHDEDATIARWDHYKESPPDRTGAGKLFKMARKACPGWRKPSEIAAAAHQTGARNSSSRTPDPPLGWESARPLLGRAPAPLQIPWVPEPPGGTVPLAEVQAAITRLTVQWFNDANAADQDARRRALQAHLAEAEQKARAKAVRAERLLHARTDRRNVLVETIQDRLASGAPLGTLRADARKADAKVRRAVATYERHQERWIEAEAKLIPPIDTPPPAKPHVINSAETATAKTGIFVKLAKGEIDTRNARDLPHKLIAMVPALRPDVVTEPDAATMAAFYADKATPRQRKRVLKFLASKEREKEGNAPRNVERLGQQMLKRARAVGIDAAVFMGRGDDNCRHIDAVDMAQDAGANPTEVVCGSKDHPCPSRAWCMREGFLAGVLRASAAEFPIVAHNFITEDLPVAVREGAWGVVIDEEFATQADAETTLTLESLGAEAIERSPSRKTDDTIDQVATAMLVDQLGRIATAFPACAGGDGYLSHEALKAAGLRLATLQDPTLLHSELRDLLDAVEARKVEPNMWPEMTLEARQEERERCKVNRVLRQMAVMVHALYGIVTRGEAGAGLISCVTDVTASGDHSRLIIRGQKPAADWIKALPVFNLNATASLDLARLTFPDMTMPPMPKAERPHAATHQVLGRWGGFKLPRKEKLIAELRAFARLHMIGRSKGLIVTYKGVEHLFSGIPDVDTAHHGDIAGDDTHRDYDFLLVIGGAFADYKDTASIAAGRGAGAVPVVPPVSVTRVAPLTDGTAIAMPDIMAYAHPGVDATHASIFRSSVIQAAGRTDQFRRTPDNPCDTFVFDNVIMDRPMHSIRYWPSVRPGRGQREIVTGWVAFGRVWERILHPDLYSSERSADSYRYREDGDIAHKRACVLGIIALDSAAWFEGTGQAAGQGQKPQSVWFRAGRGDATKAELEAKLGPLVSWEVTQITQGTDVQRSQLHQDLTRPVRSTSSEEGEVPPPWMSDGAETPIEPVHGPPDG